MDCKSTIIIQNIETLIREIRKGGKIFKNNNFWNIDKQQDFIQSLFLGVVPRPFIFNAKNKLFCIDGNQKILSILNFIENKIIFGNGFHHNSSIEFHVDNILPS